MAKDVLITPANGNVEFKLNDVTKAALSLDDSNNLVLSSVDGDVSIGTPGTNVFIGDGVNNVDVIFEQNGAIRALTGKTLTLGASGSFLSLAANITSGANITGNVQGGNLTTAGAVTGNGRALTSLNATNINTGTLPAARLSGTYTITVSGAATTAGTVTTAAQPNITSVGTLTSVTVTGNVTGGNLLPPTDNTGVVGTSALTWNNGQFTNLTVDSTLSVRAAIDLADSDQLRMGSSDDFKMYYDGSANEIEFEMETTCNQIRIHDNGTTRFTLARATGHFTATGNVTGGNLITAGLVSLSSITKTGSNGVGNIGAVGSTFNTIFAKATSAQYADVAEKYQADTDYPPGTVLIFGGDREVTVSGNSHSTDIAGVVSTDPAYIMNSGLDSGHVATVALLGRVPCQVVGMVRKGQCVVASDQPGTACALDPDQYQPGCVIGKALQDYNSDQLGTIEVVVGRI